MNTQDTICSISTPQGIGAIAIVRMSGPQSFAIAQRLFSFDFSGVRPYEAKYAELMDGEQMLDQVMVLKYVAPHSYTGEDMVEISCHGSVFIQRKILELLIDKGCRLANPGEYTMRAFMNGKMDLPQAEAVGDLIDSQSEASHHLAVNQLKGVFSAKIKDLRAQFMEFASLLELELDFSGEDVQFANRERLSALLLELKTEVNALIDSFKTGNAIKSGIPVVIIGKPNVGKSTLLNCLLQDERAIVSNIPGTTRDTIEDVLNIGGVTFRFIDTAGIRNSNDEIENYGIERTYQAVAKADIILYMVDVTATSLEEIQEEILFLKEEVDMSDKKMIIIANKIDSLTEMPRHLKPLKDYEIIYVSAKREVNIEAITDSLLSWSAQHKRTDYAMLTNVRHYDIFLKIRSSIEHIEKEVQEGIPTDLVAIDVREALHYLGLVTGEIATDDILNLVFGHFCIGK
ncbi:MAG: tRNA uridine-5-carboxymethylaminomethyl(34) synthesis GTPase MnmE [Bacteroidales bacterium]|nr:tRNA uridine-5-carboxymethylaminomethyl(34) synthesis GTPase MnmE [Bacteroidales bacterium]